MDPTRTIDVGHNQCRCWPFFAPLDVEAALEALKGILERRGIRSQPLPPASSDSHFEPPAREHPLTQEVLWDSLSAGLTPGNVVLADQGTSFYGMAAHMLPKGVTFIGQPLWASIGYTLASKLVNELVDAADDNSSPN
jgi:TPP-dependent 2-oxoacid decarboxylase